MPVYHPAGTVTLMEPMGCIQAITVTNDGETPVAPVLVLIILTSILLNTQKHGLGPQVNLG